MREEIRKAIEALRRPAEKYESAGYICLPPDRRQVVKVIKGLQAVLFPMSFRREDPEMTDEQLLDDTLRLLSREVCAAMRFRSEQTADPEQEAQQICEAFVKRLPGIRELLIKDVEALYEGDPAADSREEIRTPEDLYDHGDVLPLGYARYRVAITE